MVLQPLGASRTSCSPCSLRSPFPGCCSQPSPSSVEAHRFWFYVLNTLRQHPPSRMLALQVAAATLPIPTSHTSQPAPYGVATREPEGWQPIGWLSWYPPLGCVSVLHPGLQRGPNNGRRPAGWYTTHLSNIRATLGSRSCPYSLCPKR